MQTHEEAREVFAGHVVSDLRTADTEAICANIGDVDFVVALTGFGWRGVWLLLPE